MTKADTIEAFRIAGQQLRAAELEVEIAVDRFKDASEVFKRAAARAQRYLPLA